MGTTQSLYKDEQQKSCLAVTTENFFPDFPHLLLSGNHFLGWLNHEQFIFFVGGGANK
jgi:hypothetical protein